MTAIVFALGVIAAAVAMWVGARWPLCRKGNGLSRSDAVWQLVLLSAESARGPHKRQRTSMRPN